MMASVVRFSTASILSSKFCQSPTSTKVRKLCQTSRTFQRGMMLISC